MKKINLSIVQDIKEIKFIQKKIKKKITWLPLNLETLLYLDLNKYDYINLSKYFNNNLHREGLIFSSKLINKIDKKPLNDSSLHNRYKGIIRKYFNSIFFIIEAIIKIKKKYKINTIFVSGWNTYNPNSIYGNYIVSKIVYELFSKKMNIKIISKIKNNFNKSMYEYSIKFRRDNKKKIFIPDLGYNVKRIIYSKIFDKKISIYTLEAKNKINFKNYFLKIFGIKFLQLHKSIKKKQHYLKFENITFKYKSFDLTSLINFRTQQINSFLQDLKEKNLAIKKLFMNFRPNLIIFYNLRGVNYFISELTKKYKLNSIILSHGTLTKGRNKFEKMYQKIIADELINKFVKFVGIQTKIFLSSLSTIKAKNKKFSLGNILLTQSKNKKKMFFLYAVTQRDFVNMQFYGIETFYEFFENLKLFNKLAKDENVKFLIKLHPNIQNLKKILQVKFKNLMFSNKSLDRLFEKTSATISFSSTSIEDSLCSNIPVILFDRWNRYNHDFKKDNHKEKTKPITYVNKVSLLKENLRNYRFEKKLNFNQYIYNSHYKQNINKLFQLI